MSIYIFIDILTNGYIVVLLDYFRSASYIFGVFVVIANNPIVSVLFLIGLFIIISCYLIMLGLTYIGLAYLLVYVGAVSILFLFILMLINVRISELLSNTSNSWSLAIIIGVLFITIVGSSIPNIGIDVPLAAGLVWDGTLWESNHITSIGNTMYTHVPIWIIITGIILLLAMVGSIVITKKPENNGSLKSSVSILNIKPLILSFPQVITYISSLTSSVDSLLLILLLIFIIVSVGILILETKLYPGQVLPITKGMPFPSGTEALHPVHLPVPSGWTPVINKAPFPPTDKIFIVKL